MKLTKYCPELFYDIVAVPNFLKFFIFTLLENTHLILFFFINFGIFIECPLKSISKNYGTSNDLAVKSLLLNFGNPLKPLKNLLNAQSRCPMLEIKLCELTSLSHSFSCLSLTKSPSQLI